MSVKKIEDHSIVYHREYGLGIVVWGGYYNTYVKFDNPEYNKLSIYFEPNKPTEGKFVSTSTLSVLGKADNFRLATGAANPHKTYVTKRTDPVKERLAKIKEQLKGSD